MQTIALTPATQDLPQLAIYEPAELCCALPPEARATLSLDGVELEPFLRPGERTWRWRWNAGGAAGLHQLRLSVEGEAGASWTLERALRVAAGKLDSEQHALLLDDLQRIALSLAAQIGAAAGERAGLLAAAGEDSLERSVALLGEPFETFASAAAALLGRPYQHPAAVPADLALDLVRDATPAALDAAARAPLDAAPPEYAPALQRAISPAGGRLPRTIPGHTSAIADDRYELQLLALVLRALARRASAGERALMLAARRQGPDQPRAIRLAALAERCLEVLRRVRRLLAAPALRRLPQLAGRVRLTPRIRRDARLRTIYAMWLGLRRQPLIGPDETLMIIPIEDMPRLYESWCALRTAQALLAFAPDVLEQQMVTFSAARCAVGLSEGRPLLVVRRGELTLTLRYQPRYRPLGGARGRLGSLDDHTRVPDLAIEWDDAAGARRALLLDAKYRLAADGDGVPEDALADGYAYLGALGYDGARAAASCLLLYPGRGQTRMYASGVGAVPLLPGGADGGLAELLLRLVG